VTFLRFQRPTFTLATRARPRLNLLAKHLALKPAFELNTPFSIERASSIDDNLIPFSESQNPGQQSPAKATTRQYSTSANMSAQEPHPALLIPGPIEVEDGVLKAMAHYR
jgi:alanine-glyoxylate transaminase/serine-glyoxylate transaminase/serine-pyruvate transaminase